MWNKIHNAPKFVKLNYRSLSADLLVKCIVKIKCFSRTWFSIDEENECALKGKIYYFFSKEKKKEKNFIKSSMPTQDK